MTGESPAVEAEVEAAIGEHRWADALALLDAQDGSDRSGTLLELRAQAAYGHGDFDASIAAREAQHTLLCEAGDRPGAARAAAMVAMFLMIDTGLMAPVRGWLGRAEHLLEGDDGDPVRAVVAAVRTYERFMCGDMRGAREQSDLAIALGGELGVPAAEVIGRTAGARITILEGRVAEGLAQLDEVGALLMSGRVDPLTTGMMLCELVCAAQGLAHHEMAREWTEAMERWRPAGAFGGLHGRCRVHRAEILRVSGPCAAAEDEALRACDELRPWMRREFGWPLAELGNVRLRKGDLIGAEEAYRAAHEHVWCPHPGLALVRLAQGDVAGAAALISEAIDHPFRSPSKERPPFGDLVLAPLLEAQAEIAAAADDLATARRAAAALRVIADRYGTTWLAASAALAEARAALLAGNPEPAVSLGESAVTAWTGMGAPFEAACARMVLAGAHTRAGRRAMARLEWEAAAVAFTTFGAERHAAQARARLGTDGPGSGAPSEVGLRSSAPAASGTFRRQGDMREISFAGRSTVVRDLKGHRYLARLLADPGRELHVLDLVAVERGTLPSPTTSRSLPCDLDRAATGLPLLDEEARRAYRRRLAEVEEEIDDAVRCNDPARAELGQRDRDYLIAELTSAVGLGGRLRSTGSDAERARSAVARALRYAVGRLEEQAPELAGHLANCVHTGTYCCYRPDALVPITWLV